MIGLLLPIHNCKKKTIPIWNGKEMITKTENEIMKNWSKFDSLMVSIRCIAYNHEAYIANALDSFLEQETNFPFEIVVHDDASTDKTANIIKEYEKKFPRIVKPIYEKENQYRKKDGSFQRIINEKLRGKYIALCEGDDYWCNPCKLKKTVEFLEKNNNYSACVHNTIKMDLMSKNNKQKVMFSEKDSDLKLQEIFDGNDWHTSSIVCRSEYWLNRPSFCFAQPGVGDYPLKIFLVLVGSVKRFGKIMSVYRYGVPNSWSIKTCLNAEKVLQNSINASKMLCMANEWSNYNYDDVFRPKIVGNLYNFFTKLGRFDEIKREPYASLWKSESVISKIKYYLRCLKYTCKLKDKNHLIKQVKEIDLILKRSFPISHSPIL